MKPELEEAIKRYLYNYWKIEDNEEIERLISGIYAFIAVNVWKEPYYPVIGVEKYEETKKWWQFWK